jgi:shikimate dehydrogenase
MEGTGGKWESLEFLEVLPKSAAVCDLIYKPEKTELLARAEALGYKIMNGLGMLIYQGIIADEHYLGITTDRKAAAQLVRENLRRN